MHVQTVSEICAVVAATGVEIALGHLYESDQKRVSGHTTKLNSC